MTQTRSPSLLQDHRDSAEAVKWRYLVALRMFAVIGSLYAIITGGASPPGDAATDTDARFMCRQFVEDRLKAPATADFCNETVTALDGDRFRVAGSVDSENSFGATLRTEYSCALRYDGDERWTLTDLELEDG